MRALRLLSVVPVALLACAPVSTEPADSSRGVGRTTQAAVSGVGYWEPLTLPASRFGAGAELDGSVIFFGGEPFSPGTWRFDGTRWSVSSASPQPPGRFGHAMALRRGSPNRVVLFGGVSTTGALLGDLWEFDGTAWRNVPLLGLAPTPRAFHTLTTFGNDVLLFGGTNGVEVFGELWRFDGSGWAQLPDGPMRQLHAAGAVDGGLVVVGGTNAVLGTPSNDTYRFTGSSWVQLANGPTPGLSPAMAGPTDDLLLYGGFASGGANGNASHFDGTTWSTVSLSGGGPEFVARSRHVMTTLGSSRLIINGEETYGGGVPRLVADTFRVSGTTVSPVAPFIPASRASAGLAALGGGALLLYGGQAEDSTRFDTFIFRDGGWFAPSLVAPLPGRRFGHAMTSLGAGVLMYGGEGANQLTDTWYFDGGAWSMLAAGPPARRGAVMATTDAGAFLLAGLADGGGFEVWRYQTNWVLVPLTPGPLPRGDVGAAVQRDAVLLMGGRLANGALSADVFRFDGGQVTGAPQGPPAREGVAMTSIGGTVVLFGGRDDGGVLDETWEFDGLRWSLVVTDEAPAPRANAAFATAGGEAVLLGGRQNGGLTFRDTWRYHPNHAEGVACLIGAECASGFCTDGVCCESACGNSASDCQVCSIAAGGTVDGRCTFLGPAFTCRQPTGACDQAELCSGDAGACPVDRVRPLGDVCRVSAGGCDLPESCDGVSTSCPANGFLPSNFVCATAACSAGRSNGTTVCGSSQTSCPIVFAACPSGACQGSVCAPLDAGLDGGRQTPDAAVDGGGEPDASMQLDASVQPDASTDLDASTQLDGATDLDASVQLDASVDAGSEFDGGFALDAGDPSGGTVVGMYAVSCGCDAGGSVWSVLWLMWLMRRRRSEGSQLRQRSTRSGRRQAE